MTRPDDVRRRPAALAAFLATEAAGGALLVAAAVGALVWANSPWQDAYHSFWSDRRGWVDEGLMTIFFLVAALEVKRELTTGELRDARRAVLPVAAALGGMVAPALLYLAVNAGGSGGHGWGVPMATDIAFAVAVLAVVAPRVPPSLRAFLLTLAIVDDIGAIVVIAVAYSSGIDARWLVVAVAMVVAVLVVRRRMAVVPVTGAALWVALHHAGVHPTLAGVVLGLAAPGGALLERVERGLHRWSSFVIVPLFAFANAGLTFTTGGVGDALGSAVAGGVLLGLVVGKPVGITAGAWASERLGLARRPDGLAWRDVLGAGALGGIGFTVSLFVVGLAFDDAANADAATMGVFAAAALASALGAVLLRRRGAPIVLTVETVEVDDRCPSCGRRLGEILRVRYSGRAVIVHFEVEQDGERIELVHHCGDE